MISVGFPEKWQIVSGVELVWKVWGDEHLIYHSGSSDVHLLSPIVAKIVRDLQNAPIELTDLAKSYPFDGDSAGELPSQNIKEIIRQLYKLCLIEPCLS